MRNFISSHFFLFLSPLSTSLTSTRVLYCIILYYIYAYGARSRSKSRRRKTYNLDYKNTIRVDDTRSSRKKPNRRCSTRSRIRLRSPHPRRDPRPRGTSFLLFAPFISLALSPPPSFSILRCLYSVVSVALFVFNRYVKYAQPRGVHEVWKERREVKRKEEGGGGPDKTSLLARLFSKVAVSLSRLVTIVLLPVSTIRAIVTFRE